MSEQTPQGSMAMMPMSTAVMPVMDIAAAIRRRNMLYQFVKSELMVPGIDFGKVPGTDKDTLLKPGAEKLMSFFGLMPILVPVTEELDWTGERHGGEPFFYFKYRCDVFYGSVRVTASEGICSSMEKKYRYRWVPAHEAEALGIDVAAAPKAGGRVSEFDFAIDKAETGGKYGKPASYWQQFRDAITNNTAKRIKKKIRDGSERDAWEIDSTMVRVTNPDIPELVNTVAKMAQKRALVGSALIAVNASEFFTQDIEDSQDIIEGNFTVRSEAQKPVTQPAQPSAQKPAVPQQDDVPEFDTHTSVLHGRVEESAKKYLNQNRDANENQRTMCFLLVKEACGNDEAKRHTVQHALTGFEKWNDIPGAYVLALIEWLKPYKNGDGKYHPDKGAIEDVEKIVKEALIQAGQQALPLS